MLFTNFSVKTISTSFGEMIVGRLLSLMGRSLIWVFLNVGVNWVGLIFQIVGTFAIASLLDSLRSKNSTRDAMKRTITTTMICVIVRILCGFFGSYFSYRASKQVKRKLREMIYSKLLRLGASYNEKVATSEIVQVTGEGVEQLEIYYGSYIPQFFYSMIAPFTLFFAFSYASWRTGLVLIACVPLIPFSLMVIGKFAKRMLKKYWGIYIGMGDTFLENLQGLTTLKIYQADEYKNTVMNEKAEDFRKITMKVLFMQLASIIVMDFVAYGGAGAGIIMTLFELKKGRIGFEAAFAMMMLSAEFFLPMRALGSLFHVAMNGISASTKIFHLLDLPEEEEKTEELAKSDLGIKFENVRFGYEAEREILHGISLDIPSGKFVSIVGESGCGKSTISQLISGVNRTKVGNIVIGGKSINDIRELSLMSCITTVTHNSYIFKGTVRSNLIIAKQNATDEEMWASLGEVNLREFFKTQNGLDTELAERGANLSGGQCQRLAMARALLADSPIYIFDEATSNIDVESEEAIMTLIHKLAKTRTVILISHRLANVVESDMIYVLEDGHIAESGSHKELMANKGPYEHLYTQQYNLEHHIRS